MKLKLPWMSRADRRAWKTASTLPELGEVTAQWLEGRLASQPGYQPNYGPDEETLPHVGTLAAINRAGLVTGSSQPGEVGIGWDGAWYEQRAAVEGLVAADGRLLRRLVAAAESAGLLVVVHDRLDAPGTGAVPVTTRNTETVTAFGGALSRSDLRLLWQGFPRAQSLAAEAVQLTLVDPHWGPSSRLWDVLDAIADGEDEEDGGEPRCAHPAELITEEEVAAAAAALNSGDQKPADELVARSGEHGRATAMRVLGHCALDQD